MISLLISLLVSIPAEARFVTVVSHRKPVVASPPQMAMPIADGFVICGDTLDQSPRGDGCRIRKKLPCAGFCLSPNMEIETLSYRQFLQERVPAASK